MENYTTLTQFIEEQCTRFEIPNTEKNQRKLRIKFTRELKKLGIWDNAESKLIGRKHTKVFTRLQLQQLYVEVESYLLKHSDIDIEELKEYRQNFEQYIENVSNQTNESYQQQLEAEQYEPPRVTKREAMEVMLTALFEKFFEPLDIEQWNNDKEFVFYTDFKDEDSIDYFKVTKRLNDPIKYYTKPRQ